MEILEGLYLGNEKGFGFVKISEEIPDIFIAGKNKRDAMDKDIVSVKVLNKKQGSHKEGIIIKVVKRNTKQLVGTFQKNKNFGFVIPDSKEIGTDIFVSKSNFAKAKDNQKVVVKITKYPTKGKKAEGKIIEVLGFKDEAGIDMLSIIKEYDLPYEFKANILKEAKSVSNVKLSKEGRVDLRDKEMFTIDGEDAKDLDDAVYVEKNEDETYNLGVHIADVSHYVKEGSMLNKEAIKRGTSVYMLDRVIPMLPKELSNGICSLNPNVLRCAISCEMEIDNLGNFVSKRVFPSIIKSRKKMNYDDVNVILEGGHVEGYEEFESTLHKMLELSKLFKKRKIERGEIEFSSSEIKLIVDENGKLIEIKKRKQGLGENLIEDFMIASNESCIEIITNITDAGLYRIHGRPSPKKIEEFVKFVSALGYKLTGKYDYNDISARDIQSMLKQLKGTKDEEVLNRKLLRSMQKAIYSTDNIGHFGLGSPKYTHETSPIRRFCDLLIHYLIKIVVFEWDMGVTLEQLESGLVEACEHISMTERRSDECEYAVNDMKIAEYMENHIGEEYDAIVDTLMKNGFFVETENYVDGFVSLDTINDYYILSDDNMCYTNRKKQIALRLGDKVRVKCIAASKETRHVDFMLIEGDNNGDIK